MSCTPWYGTLIALAAGGLVTNARYTVAMWRGSSDRQRLDLVALLVFAAVALYRAALPTRYFDRQVWHDTVFSNLLAVRLLALCAELALAWLVYRSLQQSALPRAAVAVLVLLVAAQGFATAGTVHPEGWLFAVEESLWTAAAVLVAVEVAMSSLTHRAALLLLLVVYIAFQGWHLAGLWADYDKNNTHVSYNNTSKARTDCADYGAEFLMWSFVYFGVLPYLLCFIHYNTLQ